jgi:hypothetical protein
VFHSLNCLLGSSPDPWTDRAGVKPNGRRSTASGSVPMTCFGVVHPHRDDHTHLAAACVRGVVHKRWMCGWQPNRCLQMTLVVRVRHLGADLRWEFNDRLDKSPRARNQAARTTGCLLDRACFAVLSRKLRYESSSSHLCKCSSELLAPSFSLPVLPSSDDTALQACTPSGRSR